MVVKRRRRRLQSVRARTTAAACLVLGCFLIVASLGFTTVLRHSLVRAVDHAAKARAEDLAAVAAQGTLPPILASPGEEDTLIQVVDAAGAVVATSANLAGRPPVARFRPVGQRVMIRTLGPLPLKDRETYRVVALQADGPGGPFIVYVGRTLEEAGHGVAVAGGLLAIGMPVVVLLMGVTTWVAAGRALRPVEAIRAEVADITAHDLHRRVPQSAADDEVAGLAATMNAMLDRLESAVERQRRFTGDASHELQSPLAALRAELEVALAQPAAADWKATAERLLEDVERQEELVRDLLYLARAEAVPVERQGLVDLDDVVLAEVERLRARAGVRVDASRVSAAPLRGHRDDLARVVRNLLENAVRHARNLVQVEVGTDDGWATLAVADDGPGIPPSERHLIFERFARLDTGRSRDEGGTGLGLAIAREVVAAHGGAITVEDCPAGARLLVRLPADS
jgi:signal transduction histidine kinase